MRLRVMGVLMWLLCGLAVPAWAARCEGGYCNVCTNCSRCNYCSSGGTCSVCQGRGGGRGSDSGSSSSDSHEHPSPEPDSFVPDSSSSFPAQDDAPVVRRQAPIDAPTPDPELERELRREKRRVAWQEQERREQERAALLEAAPFSGRCVSVERDNTLRVQRGRRREKVVLYAVAAPMAPQPFGALSHTSLRRLVAGRQVKVFPHGRDATARRLGWVFVGNSCVNRAMVERGLAWHAAQVAPSEAKLAALQTSAQQKRAGLWAKQAVELWKWQQGVRLASWTPPAKDSAPARPASVPPPLPPAPEPSSSSSSWPVLAGLFALGGGAFALWKRSRP